MNNPSKAPPDGGQKRTASRGNASGSRKSIGTITPIGSKHSRGSGDLQDADGQKIDVIDAKRAAARAAIQAGCEIVLLQGVVFDEGRNAVRCTCRKGFDCPVQGKHPVEKGWQRKRYAPDDITGDLNWGIRTGKASGVVVLDIDDRGRIAEIQKRCGGELPRTARVITGGREGLHIYFAHPGFTVKNCQGKTLDGVDVKGDDSYVVGAWSFTSGHYRYTQNYQLGAVEVAEIPDGLAEFFKARADDEPADGREVEEDSLPVPRSEVAAILEANEAKIFAAIQKTKPRRPGTRNKRIMAFAGELKRIPALAVLPAAALEGVAWRWWIQSYEWNRDADGGWRKRYWRDKAESGIGETVKDFRIAWSRAKPAATLDMGKIFEKARARLDELGTHPGAQSFGLMEGETHLLAFAFEALREEKGAEEYFIPIRDAARELGVSETTAKKRFRALRGVGILKLVKASNFVGKRLANIYEYVDVVQHADDKLKQRAQLCARLAGWEDTIRQHPYEAAKFITGKGGYDIPIRTLAYCVQAGNKERPEAWLATAITFELWGAPAQVALDEAKEELINNTANPEMDRFVGPLLEKWRRPEADREIARERLAALRELKNSLDTVAPSLGVNSSILMNAATESRDELRRVLDQCVQTVGQHLPEKTRVDWVGRMFQLAVEAGVAQDSGGKIVESMEADSGGELAETGT